ncbi:FAD-dependent oxidoreductase domain-containing protein 2 [Synchiropus splendidus]|uniref:FAD-dependent oxidoreductase domain-containing protein 2 n=1 Tax=Synchiropus splendidus TaxID=270530 RepID=UPI00237DBFA7|nr:FAD-dependent oxidoreductase domain-containing protein 2 [Synchiropus splendidus]XP_053707511.1 FAD-dependent oxidoreductase domain-containing protein 2 [Synchiropus splendidus]XP_053707512.1 FAD-dependent oxidoreductase domain-containing protein 2 [Synchiropus splendidus]XP_053707513.1 FAD-dependent oxidoreductase domain-containing protein 2 [Synchiropus splendidus]
MDRGLLPSLILFILADLVTSSHPPEQSQATLQHDYCVLGAGPAGLQMGHFLSKSQRDYIILERNAGPGSFFNRYPRHRKLISINKIHTGRHNREFNLRHDWNSLLSDRADLLFQRVSSEFYPPADAYPHYLSMFVRELGLKVRYGVDVGRIRAANQSYILTDQRSTDYRCSVLLVATGLWVPHEVPFVGADLVEGYESISTNPDDYKNQAVLILGKGNSAFETAQSILGSASFVHMASRSPVRLAWQTHYVGDLRAVNNELIDTYQLKSLNGMVETRLESIAIARRKDSGRNRRREKKLYVMLQKFLDEPGGWNRSDVSPEQLPAHHIDNFSMRKPYDRVIRCLGFRFNFSIFDRSACPPNSPNTRGRLPQLTPWWEGPDTPGLFVLGTAAHSRDYRKSAGGFIHGFRYTVRAVHRLLERRHHSVPWPSTRLTLTQLHSWILKRVGEASGPYQMFEVLGDVILLRGAEVLYVEEFPLQALPQFSSLSGHEVSGHGLIVLVMQYGKKKIDFLGSGRAVTDWTKAWRSNFLHPVLYFYETLPTEKEMRLRPHGWPLPRPKAVHHMVEDFLTEWDRPVSHVQPLRRFLEHCVQTDLRDFYAETCFRLALTRRTPPLSCRHGYLQQRGLPRRSNMLPQHFPSIPLTPAAEDMAGTDIAAEASSYRIQAEASMTSGLKLEL